MKHTIMKYLIITIFFSLLLAVTFSCQRQPTGLETQESTQEITEELTQEMTQAETNAVSDTTQPPEEETEYQDWFGWVSPSEEEALHNTDLYDESMDGVSLEGKKFLKILRGFSGYFRYSNEMPFIWIDTDQTVQDLIDEHTSEKLQWYLVYSNQDDDVFGVYFNTVDGERRLYRGYISYGKDDPIWEDLLSAGKQITLAGESCYVKDVICFDGFFGAEMNAISGKYVYFVTDRGTYVKCYRLLTHSDTDPKLVLELPEEEIKVYFEAYFLYDRHMNRLGGGPYPFDIFVTTPELLEEWMQKVQEDETEA